MDSEAPIGEIRRGSRRWRRVVLVLLALPFAAFLFSNVLLASPWACRRIAGKIQNRAGLETRIAGASWSPWGGVRLNGLEFLQPVPLRETTKESIFSCTCLRITPIWRAWLRGRLEVSDIEFDSPRVYLPVEVISSLAGSRPTAVPPAVAPPPVASAPPLPPPATAPPALPTASPPDAPPLVAIAPPPQPTGWLRFKNASFAIVHAGSGRTLLEFSNTSGSIPIAGDPAQSVLKIEKVTALENPIATGITANLDWTSPLLSLKPLDFVFGGYKFLIAAKIAKSGGFPLQIEAQFPQQPLSSIVLPFDSNASARSLTANGRFRGLLLAPASWQGDLLAEAASPSLRAAGHDAEFDKASIVTVLRGGILSCVDARMVSDNLSLLGNATVLADGRLAGAARVVSPPESAAAIASRIFPALEGAPSLTPLSTPQRAAFDVEAFGNVSRIFLRLGRDGPIINLNRKPTP